MVPCLCAPVSDQEDKKPELGEILSNSLKQEIGQSNPDFSQEQTKTEQEVSAAPVELSQLTQVLVETTKVMQMFLLKEIGTENYYKSKNVLDHGESISDEMNSNSEENRSPVLSNSEECRKLTDYSNYKFSVFTQISNLAVNSCVSLVLKNMRSDCFAFYSNEPQLQEIEQQLKYFTAIQLFSKLRSLKFSHHLI